MSLRHPVSKYQKYPLMNIRERERLNFFDHFPSHSEMCCYLRCHSKEFYLRCQSKESYLRCHSKECSLRCHSKECHLRCQSKECHLRCHSKECSLRCHSKVCPYFASHFRFTISNQTSGKWRSELLALSAEEPRITGLFWGKWPIKIRHSMGLRDPVSQMSFYIY